MTALNPGERVKLTHHLKDNPDADSDTDTFEVQEVSENGVAVIVSLKCVEEDIRSRWTMTHYPDHAFETVMENRHGTQWVVTDAERA